MTAVSSHQVESEELVKSEATLGDHAVGLHEWLFKKSEYEKKSIIKSLKKVVFILLTMG